MPKRKKGCKNAQRMIKLLHNEVLVAENFEVLNGILGLERDVYLSIVKFLDSSILRKVRVNIFFLFFYVFFVVHWH
jgi:hypothetical protein